MKNFQSLKPKIEALIEPILAKNHLKVYEVNNLNEFGNDILQILVEDETNPRKAFDLDFMLKVNEEVSAKLDELDSSIETNYLLEVASAGVERKLKNEEEMINSVEAYVYVELNQLTKEKLNAFNATIESYDPTSKQFELTYFVKGQKKKIKLLFSEIKFIRYAVKF